MVNRKYGVYHFALVILNDPIRSDPLILLLHTVHYSRSFQTSQDFHEMSIAANRIYRGYNMLLLRYAQSSPKTVEVARFPLHVSYILLEVIELQEFQLIPFSA